VPKTEATLGGSVMWTAAKENSCGNKFEWCSQKLFFHLNPELVWKKQQNISPSDKCVTFELNRDDKDGRLGRSNCQKQQRIVCEVSIRNLFYQFVCVQVYFLGVCED
jgi:hypothetical protein